MNYLELIFDTTKMSSSDQDILIGHLSLFGFTGFNEKAKTLNAFVDRKLFNKKELNKYFLLHNINPHILCIRELKNKNWNSIWESSFDPIFINKLCCVRAPFHNVNSDFKYDILINPNMSFGTGHHPTTLLMIKQLLSLDLKDKVILDVGSGTGILSILSEKKGAKQVFSLDIDQYAYDNSLENINLNHCQKISVHKNDIIHFSQISSFDIILANINRNTLLNQMREYYTRLLKHGLLILSGFLKKDLSLIHNSAINMGLDKKCKTENKDWICVTYTK